MYLRKALSLTIVVAILLSLLPIMTLAQEPAAVPAAPAAVDVDPFIYEEMANSRDGRAEFFVAFNDTADLAPAYSMGWSARGHFVVDTLQATAEASQANVKAWLREHGIEYTSFWVNNTIFIRADEATLNELATFPEVSGFRGNHVYQILPDEAPAGEGGAPTAPAYPWNITYPMADQVHSEFGIKGQNMVLGGMDTGAEYDHIGLVNNYRGNLGGGNFDHTYSWYDPGNSCGGTPCDTDGHGTSTMGIMAGDDDPSLPDGAWIGMAPDAEWIHCLGCPYGSCPSSDTTACAQWFLAPGGDPDMRPTVVNHSWGLWSPNDCNGNAFQAELMAYRAADIVPAFAAGNVGDACNSSTSPANNTDPAGNPIAFASGAHLSDGSLASYSSCGWNACNPTKLFPDVASPSSGSCTTGLNDTYNCSFGGTSAASPHTAGCVTLVRQAAPYLTVDEVEQVIRDAANDVDDTSCGGTIDWNNRFGEGYLDCYEAVQMVAAGMGTIDGFVLEDGTGNPIEDAEVTATLGPTQTWQADTDGTGYYAMTVMTGTYEVEAWKFGYFPETVVGVDVFSGTTTTVDFDLVPAPSSLIYGYVTDATTGWPLYASLNIDGYPNNPVWTDPVSGYYEVSLPDGSTYDFVVNAWAPGYLPGGGSVGPLVGDTQADWALDADLSTCIAPGYYWDAGTCYAPADGGLVVGNVYDDNTLDPLNGADVSNDSGEATVTAETPDDPAVDDAFYTIFSPSGMHDHTAAMNGYQSDVETVSVIDGDTVGQDFYLGAGILSFTPTPLEATLDMGASTVVNATLDNAGSGDAFFEFLEVDGGFMPAFVSISPTGENSARGNDTGPRSGPEVEGATPAVQASSFAPNAACFVALSADNGSGPNEVAELHATLDEFGFSWVDVNTVQEARDAGADVLIDRYAAVNMPVADLDAWMNDGFGYVELGDWPAWFPDAWEGQLAGTPLNIAVADSSHPLAQSLPSSWTGLGFWAYDWSNDALGWVTDAGYPNIIEAQYSTLQERVVTFEEVGPGRAVYVGINTYGYLANDPDKQVLKNAIEWAGGCGTGDVPWLSEDPISGTVPANDSMAIDVTFDAGVPEITQPGEYYATLRVTNDTPYGDLNVPVTLTVLAPQDFGKLQGWVHGLGYCDGDYYAAEEAEVYVEGSSGMTWTLLTDIDGRYQLWLDETESPLSITVTYPEHEVGSATGVVIVGQMTTTVDFDLRWLVPCMSVVPDSLETTLNLGDTDTQQVTLTNDGAAPTDFEMVEQDGGFVPTLAFTPPVVVPTGEAFTPEGASSPDVLVQPIESRINQFSILHVATTSTGQSVERALNELGYPYDYINSTDWTTIDFSPYDIVIVGMDGGGMTTASVQKVRTDVIDQGKRLIFLGGTCWLDFAVGVNDYLVLNDINNYCWTVSGSPQWTLVDPDHPLAQGLPDTYDYNTTNAGYYATRALDPDLEVVAVNGDGYDDFFYKNTNFPSMGRGPEQTGDMIWFINSVYESYWTDQTDFEMLRQLIDNAINMTAGDVPWLSEDPVSGTVPIDGGQVTVDVTFDAGEVAQPGEYYATLNVNSDDPVNGRIGLPVTMTVLAPSDWGKLMGEVHGLGYCDDDDYPLEEATVVIDSGAMTLTTDENGVYVIWLEEGTHTVDVSADGHEDGFASVDITGGMTTTQDFDLRSIQPCVSVTPASMEATLPIGGIETQVLTLINDGAGATPFEIRETTATMSIYQNLPVYVFPTIRAEPYGGDSYSGGGYQLPDDSGGIDVPPAPKRYTSPDDLVYYSDRATFDADHPGLPVEGFENTLVPDGSIVACDGPFDSSTNNACFAPGGILDGIRLMNTVPTNQMVVIGDGALGQPSALVGPNTFTDDHDITFFNGDVYAVGFDLWSPLGAATFDIYIYGPGDVLLGQTSVLAATTGTFWGVYSDDPITRIRTESAAGDGGELFDDIAFGGSAPGGDVPWLGEDPISGTVGADTTFDVDVTFTALLTMTPDVYTAYMIVETDDAENGEIQVPVTLTIIASQCVEVSGVDLSVINPGPIYVGVQVGFSGDIMPDDFGGNYNYDIDFGDGNGMSGSSNDDPLTFDHTYTSPNTYTVAIEVLNCQMTMPVTSTVDVVVLEQPACVEVESVELTLVTTGTIYTGDMVDLSGDIMPDTFDAPYSYTIDFGDGMTPTVGTSSDDPLLFSYTYVDTGTYTVEIGVWNCEMTTPVTDTVEVDVTEEGVPEFYIYLPVVLKNNE